MKSGGGTKGFDMTHKYFKHKLIEPVLKKTLKKLAPELRELLMLQLLDKKPSHGYEIIRFFKEDAPVNLEAGANRIYPSLEKLRKSGLLDLEVDKRVSDKKPRKVYSLTEGGHRHLLEEIKELKAALHSIQEYLQDLERDIVGRENAERSPKHSK